MLGHEKVNYCVSVKKTKNSYVTTPFSCMIHASLI